MVVAIVLTTVLYCCQTTTPDPKTMRIESLHTDYVREVNIQQKYTTFIKQAEKERVPDVTNLCLAAAR
jgi:hypothetical protein